MPDPSAHGISQAKVLEWVAIMQAKNSTLENSFIIRHTWSPTGFQQILTVESLFISTTMCLGKFQHTHTHIV